MKTPIRTFQVAVAGLDLLHQTRLKLACSLLLSERMDVSVQAWPGTAPDLLVTSLEHEDTRDALGQALASGIPTLRVSRRVQESADGLLPHGATVRDFNAQVGRLLANGPLAPAQHAPAEAAAATPLLLQLTAVDRTATAGLHLLQRGAIWLLVDAGTRSIALPPGTTLTEVCQQLDADSWSASPISAADFNHQYAYRLPQRQSFEALYFALGQLRPELLPAPPASLRLRHWPDVDTTVMPSAWLLPIALLHTTAWRLDALAQHCQLPRATMTSLFAAASSSGLALAQELSVPAVAPPTESANSRFLVRLARRLGLGLSRADRA